jgi:predicted component of type VI protein secretion system
MKTSLVVLSEGKLLGRTIPITLSQFIIGRDPQCQLRPSSALISKRHCALIIRNGRVFVRDFDSTNGTFVNDQPVKGELEVKNDDMLKAGPLTFRIVIEGAVNVPVNKPTPIPQPAAASTGDDDSVAAMLLDLANDGPPGPSAEEEGASTPSTVEMLAPSTTETAQNVPAKVEEPAKPETKATEKKKAAGGDTSAAAQAILQKYMRRQRA